MELRHLRYFVAAAEELHFGRAARRLAVAQPSLSRQIQMLEREIGVRLFDRDTRRVALTDAGREYLGEARAVLHHIETASEAARRAGRGELGRLRVGFVYLAALDILPPLLRLFRRQYPDVALELHELSTESQIAEVREGKLDVGIVREPAAIRAVAAERIRTDEQVVALPAHHPLAQRPAVSLAALAEARFIMFPRNDGTALYDSVIGACAKAGFSPNIVQEARLFTTVVGLVAADVGIAIMPAVTTQIQHKAVVYRRLTPRIPVDTGLIWNAEAIASNAALKAFLALCRSAGAGEPA